MEANKCLTICFDVLSSFDNFPSPHERIALISTFWFLIILFQNFASEQLLRPWNPRFWKVAFSSLKTVWSIVRCQCLLMRIATDLEWCLKTYFDVPSARKNFGGIHKHQVGILFTPPNLTERPFFFCTFFKIVQTKSFQRPIMYSKVN